MVAPCRAPQLWEAWNLNSDIKSTSEINKYPLRPHSIKTVNAGWRIFEGFFETDEGISKLAVDLWIRHNAGLKLPENNVFWVDFPPLTEEEKAEIEGMKNS